MESGADVSHRVVSAVAEREGVEPAELRPPLFEVVDPDALDAMFARSDAENVAVEFTYLGYEVVVSQSGGVRLSRRPDGPDDSSNNRLAE